MDGHLPEPLVPALTEPGLTGLRRYALICNQRSGTHLDDAALHHLIKTLTSAGHEAKHFECTPDPQTVAECAIREGFEIVVAMGGDGTISGVAAAAIRCGAILGVVPAGTLNHFAKDLGIAGLELATQVLISGKVREVDAGSINGRTFVNNAGVGLYPLIVKKREMTQRAGVPKWVAFVAATVTTFVRMPFLRLHLETNDRAVTQTTPFLFIGNNIYDLSGNKVGSRQSLDEGVLQVCMSRKASRLALSRLAVRALFRSVRQDKDLQVITARKLTVRTRKHSVQVSLDGEVLRMQSPLFCEIKPRALQVLAP